MTKMSKALIRHSIAWNDGTGRVGPEGWWLSYYYYASKEEALRANSFISDNKLDSAEVLWPIKEHTVEVV